MGGIGVEGMALPGVAPIKLALDCSAPPVPWPNAAPDGCPGMWWRAIHSGVCCGSWESGAGGCWCCRSCCGCDGVACGASC